MLVLLLCALQTSSNVLLTVLVCIAEKLGLMVRDEVRFQLSCLLQYINQYGIITCHVIYQSI